MKKTTEELEFERSRMEILKLSGKNINKNMSDNHKKAWEYEYEEHKRRRKKESFYLFGSMCGILSLILTLILNFDTITKLF